MKSKFKGTTGFKSKAFKAKEQEQMNKIIQEKSKELLKTDLAMQLLANKLKELDNNKLSNVQLKIKNYFFIPDINNEPEIISKSYVMCKWARMAYEADIDYILNIDDKNIIIVENND